MSQESEEADVGHEAERGSSISLPSAFPLVRYYLIASVLLVISAFAILNFSTQRIQSGTAISSLRHEARVDVDRVAFDVSVAITEYVRPGDDLVDGLQANKRAFDRAVINALSGLNIVRVDLVNPDAVLAYSTDPAATSSLTRADSMRVISGESLSLYEDDYSLHLFNGEPASVSAVITGVPVNTEWSVDSSGPVAVLIAVTDVTDAIPTVTGSVAPERIAVLAGTLIAIFMLLSWVVIRGHRVTTRARETLADMLDIERDMREQLDVRNADLEDANEAKSRFLATVSHELKTPLTAIITFSGSLRKSIGDSLNERQEKQFEAMVRNGARLKALIDELLDVSAASQGKLSLSIETVKAARMIDEAVQSVQPLLDGRRQKLNVSVDDHDLEFAGDPMRLQQVMSNLLSNASKYSPRESEIRLVLEETKGFVCIEVSDDGMGMSDDDLNRLFGTFFRSQQAVESGMPGTGLGMVVVKSVIEGHGGRISIDSAVGRGTTVRVVLPVESRISEMPGRSAA